MTIELSNIIKGFKKRIFKKTIAANFPAITWMQEKILKHQEDKTVKVLKIGKLRIKYKRPYEVLHTYKELFTDEIYRFKNDDATPFIIDCGANIGLSVLYFKSVYPAAELLAFEPDESNFQLLNENIALNNLTKVQAVKAAVWVKDDVLHFSSSGSQGSKIAAENEATINVTEVKAVRLANILAQRKVDLLKIDIEGAEIDVMRDCATFLGKVDNLFVEYHGKVSETERLSELLSILNTAGFKVYIKMAADDVKLPFIDHQTKGSFDVQLNIFGYRQN